MNKALKPIFLTAVLIFILNLVAKTQPDFQQEVNHTIEVKLDVNTKALTGQIETEFV